LSQAKAKRSVAELAAAYLRHYRTKARRHAFAYEEVETRVSQKGPDLDDAWSLVRALVDAAENDRELAYVAAGPLETLVRRFAPELIERIEAASRQDAQFRDALGMIYLAKGELPAQVVDRLVRASNGRIRPLGSRGA
jgi:hypothetical protein